jgi:hypothetical protein
MSLTGGIQGSLRGKTAPGVGFSFFAGPWALLCWASALPLLYCTSTGALDEAVLAGVCRAGCINTAAKQTHGFRAYPPNDENTRTLYAKERVSPTTASIVKRDIVQQQLIVLHS